MIQRVAVIGAGTMGAGISQLCAQSGFSVKLHDALPKVLETAQKRLRDGFDAAVLKGKLTTMQAERALGSISVCAKLEEAAGADLVIEAASEDLFIKRKIFAELDKACPDAILATNTSSLSVADIAQGVKDPSRVLGMHFFNPPVAMKLVEMIRAPGTSPEVFHGAWDFVLVGLRKTPVDVKDTPGFIVNRVMRPYYVEAQRCLADGVGITQLDTVARGTGGVPMGPFELMDLIGLDVNFSITQSIYMALGRPERFIPPALQQKLVEAGCLGRKAGKGFYLYEGGKPAGENPLAGGKACTFSPEEGWRRVIGAVIAEAELALKEGVAGKGDIDTAIKLAMNFPRGPFEWQKRSDESTAKPSR
jgi:3-hydroxybutyryl-CoA dehydrogenase